MPGSRVNSRTSSFEQLMSKCWSYPSCQVIAFLTFIKSYYKALSFYLQEQPTLLTDLLTVLIPRIDHRTSSSPLSIKPLIGHRCPFKMSSISSYIIWLALSYPITGILWLILTFSSPLSIIILYGLQATPYPFSPLLDHRLLNLRLPFCHLDWDFPWLLKVSLISILRQTSPQNLADDEEGLH